MKHAIDFTVPFTGFATLDFISCFASTYVYLEKIPIRSGDDKCAQFRGEGCCSCGNCETNDPTRDLQPYYFLFDTMSGRSSLRLRFDGGETEIQKRIGATEEDGCGTDYTVDFLFGFAGYEYRKLTIIDDFKTAIAASIDAGIPVIAKVRGNNGRFRVITGYDGDELIYPNFTNAQQRPDTTSQYDDLDSLYIIGNKTTSRYTVKDCLERICEVMEYNLTEGLMMGYVEHLGWYSNGKDGMGQVDEDGRKARMQRVADTMWYIFNSHNFAEVFRAIRDDKAVYDEISDMKKLHTPDIKELCNKIGGSYYGYTHDLAWALIGLNERTQESWDSIYACGWAEMIEMVLTQIDSNDVAVLESIKKIIDILEK